MSEEKQSPQTNKSVLQRIFTIFPVLSILGLTLGAIGGYVYYLKIGCSSGSCAITSNPYMSVLWGALIGYLFFDMFNRKPKKEHKS